MNREIVKYILMSDLLFNYYKDVIDTVNVCLYNIILLNMILGLVVDIIFNTKYLLFADIISILLIVIIVIINIRFKYLWNKYKQHLSFIYDNDDKE